MIGLSNYHGLCDLTFNLSEYLTIAGGNGFEFTRVFCDLPPLSKAGSMNPDKSIFIYPYDKVKGKFNLNKINQAFVDRLGDVAKKAKAAGLSRVILCTTTIPDYYKNSVAKSFIWQMGYHAAKELQQQADFTTGPWTLLKQYWQDLAGLTSISRLFKLVEWTNEHPWGSIHDELKGFVASMPNNRLQINPPNIKDPTDPVDWPWPRRLQNGVGGVKASQTAYHSYFLPSEITKDAATLVKNGIDMGFTSPRNTFETDGATPNGDYSYTSKGGHYKFRPIWRTMKAKVIKTHANMILAARSAMINFNIQDIIKWDGKWDYNDPDIRDAYRVWKKAIGEVL